MATMAAPETPMPPAEVGRTTRTGRTLNITADHLVRPGPGAWVFGPERSPIIMDLACTAVGDKSTRVGVAFRSEGMAEGDGAEGVTSVDRRGRSAL
jgi:hypothetical protein